MILADKIIKLRKKNSWSQEELAEKLNVSRQAVSKWEGAQTVPDLEKILQLGRLFSVTTDYLLKDDMEDEEFSNDDTSDTPIKKISMEYANEFIDKSKRASWRIAFAVFLCIISPITLIVLTSVAGLPSPIITETIAGALGLSVLFAFILCAVPIFIYCGFQNEQYAFLDKNVPFELEYGVKGLVTERKKEFRSKYITCNITATCLCIFSAIPLIISGFLNNELLSIIMLALLILIVAVAVGMFIVVGIQNASMQKLLREGEYTEKEKAKTEVSEAIEFAYWGILTAIYLAWSFGTSDWHITWIVFVIGGFLSPVVSLVCSHIASKRKK